MLRAAVGTLADGNGQVVGWGYNGNGEITIPAGNYTAIAGSANFSAAIRSNGSLAAWGDNSNGQTNLPLSLSMYTAIAAGDRHGLALRSDGGLVGWGRNAEGQATVPSGTFTAIAAGFDHSLGIRTDGTLAGWGLAGGATVPSGTFTAIAGGGYHSLGIRSDGTLAGWGSNDYGQTTVPSGTFTAIEAGLYHSLGIKTDGTLAGWGRNHSGQTAVPSGTFTAIAAGGYHGLGIRSDGTLAGWGDNGAGQSNVPSGTFVAIAGGSAHSLGLRARTEYDGDLLIAGSGMQASLNRSINVAGNARIESPMYLYNNPRMNVAGKITFANVIVNGAGTISAGGSIEIAESVAFSSGVAISSAGPLMGNGNLNLGPAARVTAALAPTTLFHGNIMLDESSVLSFTGTGSVGAGNLDLYYGDSELRLTAGQRMHVSGYGNNYGRIEVLGNGNVLGGTAELEYGDCIANYDPSGLITGRDAVLRFGDVGGLANGLINQGSLALTGGTNDLFGDIENTGSIVVTGGAGATFYDDVIQNGTLRVSKVGSSSSTAVFLGSYSGGGATGGGDIFFEGDLRPGQSPAQVTFNNNVSLGTFAGLNIELGGLAPGTQYDKVVVNGELSLVGTLIVNLIDSFTPQAGNSFDVLDWSSLHGTFSEIKLPTLNSQLAWDTSQLYTIGVLNVVSTGVPGDYNQNGVVEAADYVVWRKNDGTQTGYDTWRSNFGRTAGSGAALPPAHPLSAAVPEPGAQLLGMLALPFLRRRLRMPRMPKHQ